MDSLTHLLLAMLIIGLLVGGWYINLQFQRMRESYRRLEALLLALAQAERRANRTLDNLRASSEEVDAHIGARMKRMRQLVDQLELMSRAGDSLATRLAQAGRLTIGS